MLQKPRPPLHKSTPQLLQEPGMPFRFTESPEGKLKLDHCPGDSAGKLDQTQTPPQPLSAGHSRFWLQESTLCSHRRCTTWTSPIAVCSSIFNVTVSVAGSQAQGCQPPQHGSSRPRCLAWSAESAMKQSLRTSQGALRSLNRCQKWYQPRYC